MSVTAKSPEESNAEAVTPIVLRWAAVVTVLRLLLTTGAHYREWLLLNGAPLGWAAVALCGFMYVRDARRSMGDALWHGGMVGGIGGFLGTAVAIALADQVALALLWETLAGMAIGAAAGAAAHKTL